MSGTVRAQVAVGPMGPEHAGVLAAWDESDGAGARAGGGPAGEAARRALLAAAVALAADCIAEADGGARTTLLRELADLGPAEMVVLAAGRAAGAPPLAPGPPEPGWSSWPMVAVAAVEAAGGDDPEDGEALVRPGRGRGALPPEAVARLVPAAVARALPRDLELLARLGVALRTLAREAVLYPATFQDMVPGIAAAARDPAEVREFGRVPAPPQEPGPAPVQEARPERPPWPVGRIAAATAVALAVASAGGLVAALVFALLDPVSANRGTAIVAGVAVGLAVGVPAAVRAFRPPRGG